MSHNRNFYNNYHGSNFTFRYVPDFPPPPLPPTILRPMRPYFSPTHPPYLQTITAETIEKDDQEFIKTFEIQTSKTAKILIPKLTTISRIREEIQYLLTAIKDFERQLNHLTENMDQLPEEKWKKTMDEMDEKKKKITSKLKRFVGSYMDLSRRLLAKRTSKRLRLKRLETERKSIKKGRIKHLEERSRKIDENLQKIKDDILKAQKVEATKLEADVVLKEVRRQKYDAKKCLIKLDALLKLRKARLNTAKGCGGAVSEKDAATFTNNIEKLKMLWNQKLLIYEKEEADLKLKLAEDAAQTDICLDNTLGLEANLAEWREVLFGDIVPQVDFHGDIHRFIAVRSQWDTFMNENGSPLPVGWVVPPLDSSVNCAK